MAFHVTSFIWEYRKVSDTIITLRHVYQYVSIDVSYCVVARHMQCLAY